jgi:predicted AAA+ superfamily ATPase
MEGTLRSLISEWFSSEIPKLVRRDISLPIRGNALALIGPRRAGKTFMMYQIASDLMQRGIARESIVYLNFEDLRLSNLRGEDFPMFLKILAEMTKPLPSGEKALLLLDEVQNLKEWGRWVRSLLDRGYAVVVSGSSSKVGVREIPTELRGRYLERLVLPLSFREFLKFREVNIDYLEAPEKRGRILRYLREYLMLGGFPEVVLNPEHAKELLRVYRETVFYRDIIERFRVRDISSFRFFLEMLEGSFGNYFSLSSAQKTFKSMGIKKSKKTLANYFKYCEDSFYILSIRKFSFSRKAMLQQPRKVYPIDTGYMKGESIGRRMESSVAIELMRRGDEAYYMKEGDSEVDFLLVRDRAVEEAIQVSYSLDEVEKREIEGLKKAFDLFGGIKASILTWDLEGERSLDGRTIRLIPLWKWLLSH